MHWFRWLKTRLEQILEVSSLDSEKSHVRTEANCFWALGFPSVFAGEIGVLLIGATPISDHLLRNISREFPPDGTPRSQYGKR